MIDVFMYNCIIERVINMFTYLKLHNFKSFGNIEFNFKKTKKETKKFIAIYGENGCGKTNFVSAFEFLYSSMTAFMMRKAFEQVFSKRSEDKAFTPFAEAIRNSIVDFSDYRMLECTEPTVVEYGFEHNGADGYYRIVFTDSIIEEELYHLIGTRRGKLFSVKKKDNDIDIIINNSTFSAEYKQEFEKELKKYWGKNSFVSIFFKELSEKNKLYIDENVSKLFTEIMMSFLNTGVFKVQDLDIGSVLRKIKFPGRVRLISASGITDPDGETVLDENAEIIRTYFTQIYSDVRNVYYEKNKYEDRIEYKLHIQKMISGKVRDVLFDYESTGTKKTLEIINAMVGVMNGATVVYDEIDEGIHDLLMKSIVSSLNNSAKGQLIITTHNTLLLETIDPQSAYVIYVDCDGNKEARCCADYGIRVQKTNNMRNQYLKGMFGGIPYASDIDLSYMTFEDGGDAVEE